MKTSEKFKKFCGVCDKYAEDEPCTQVGLDNQIRYVGRGWCGWGEIGGVRVAGITSDYVDFSGDGSDRRCRNKETGLLEKTE